MQALLNGDQGMMRAMAASSCSAPPGWSRAPVGATLLSARCATRPRRHARKLMEATGAVGGE